jgi:adenylate cyclase
LIYWQAWKKKWHVNSGSRLAGWTRARQALDTSMRQPTPLAHSLQSAMHLYNRRYQQAIDEANKAVNLNPNSATGYLALADAQAFNGDPEAAIMSVRKAMRLDPNFQAPYLTVQGRAYFDLQQYDQAIASLKRAISINPDDNESLVLLLASYGQRQQKDQLVNSLEQLNRKLERENLPKFTLDWPKNRWPYRNSEDRNRLIQGLKKAGVPEW